MDYNLAIISFCLSLPILILSQKYFLKKKYIDQIISRSSHSSIATRSGGISIFTTLFILSIIFYLDGKVLFDYSYLIPLSLLFMVGLYDDINSVDYKLKFIFQIIAAKIIIDNGLIIDNLHGFAGIYEISRVAAQILTVFIIVAIINSINFIDGIDGLAISIVIFFVCGFEFFALEQTSYKNLSAILISSILPLFYFNFRNNNKVFLGDSGSLFLGGIVSIYVIKILTNNYIIKPEYDIHKILFVISILFYPIIDIIRVFFLRLYKGKSPFKPDKNHIHHLLLERVGRNHIYVTILILMTSLSIIMLNLIFL